MPRALLCALTVLCAVSAAAGVALAARFDHYPPPPGTCPATDGIAHAAALLRPGDELVLHDGIYCQTGRRLIAASGTARRPIVIRAAAGAAPLLTRPEDPHGPQRHEGTEVDGAHLLLRGLRFHRGNRGLVFLAGAHHITLEDSEVAYTANNAVTLNDGDTDSFVIRRNHIHHTGRLAAAHGGTEGEGLYVGCNQARCIASNHLIEDNLIHHTRATTVGGNDGIELKYGSYGNVVRGNVIHTILPVTDAVRYPCIFAYGVRDRDIARPNVIEGNRLNGCGEAIQVVADAIVRDNLVLNSEAALATYYHAQVPVQRNLRIVRNTFFGSRLALEFGLNADRWEPPRPPPVGIVFADNAIYGWGFDPLVTVNLPFGGDIALSGNAIEGVHRTGRLRILTTGGVHLGAAAFFDGGDVDRAFIGPGRSDYRPAPDSQLRGAGIARFIRATLPPP